MNAALKRILETPLDVDVRGSACRVVVAADKYTIANISVGANDREEYARFFAAAADMFAALKNSRTFMENVRLECGDHGVGSLIAAADNAMAKAASQ